MITPSFARSFGQIGALTAASRALGLLRDIVFATFLGAGPAADAFLVALKLPNMFRRLSAEGGPSTRFSDLVVSHAFDATTHQPI